MAGYIVRRLLSMVGMLIALTISTFVLFSIVPTDVARLTCGKTCTPDILEANRTKLGLDKPLFSVPGAGDDAWGEGQYNQFMKGIFVGRTYGTEAAAFECPAPCLGYSFRKNAEVTQLIKDALPVSIALTMGAFIIWMVVGVSAGVVAALNRGTWKDKSIMAVALAGYSLPAFFLGLVMLLFFVFKWQVLPYVTYVPITENPQEWFQSLILPWITLAILYAAFYSRITRGQMLETLGDDYIRTARAKGLPERTVIGRHAFRAGLSPIVTAAGLDLAGLLGGAIITETVFSLPGLGSLSVKSVLDYDLPLIVGITLVASTFVIVANLVVDVLYAFIDPRVRLT